LRPLLLIPAYILLALGPFLGATVGTPAAMFVALAATLVCFLLHASWVTQAAAFAAAREPGGAASRAALIRYLPYAALTFAAGAIACDWVSHNFAGTAGATTFDSASMTLAMAAVISFCAMNWTAAQALCSAEAGRPAPAHAVLGTFLQFVYLVVGSAFIYRRLQALAVRTASVT
jgi:hypothetical protein